MEDINKAYATFAERDRIASLVEAQPRLIYSTKAEK